MENLWGLFLLLLCAPAVLAHRVPPQGPNSGVAPVLGSPMYTPLSFVAYHVTQLSEVLPKLHRQALGDEVLLRSLETFENRNNRLKPILENVFLLLSDKTHTKVQEDMLRSDFEAVQSILSQLQRQGQEMQELDDSEQSKEVCEALLQHVQQALYHAAGLGTHLDQLDSKPAPLAEKWILAEYLPNAERVFSLEKKMDQIPVDEAEKVSFAEGLRDAWERAHKGLERSGRRMFQLISKLKNSIPRRLESDDQPKLAAVLQFIKTDIVGPLKTETWETLRERLSKAEEEARKLLHGCRLPRRTTDTLGELTLAAGLSTAYQIENVIGKLLAEHENLHHCEERIRFISARAERERQKWTEPLEQNDELRSKLNKLRHDLVSMIKAVRHDMAAMLGIATQKQLSAANLDLMRPVERFAELEGRARKYNLSTRFESEFQELKALLNDLHRDASRLRRFLEVQAPSSTSQENLEL